jgi:predicted nuclease of restriction endonuclease-like (RecB) superfamily
MPKARKTPRRSPSRRPASPVSAVTTDRLLRDIRALIEAARGQTAQVVNSGQVLLYWGIGKRSREDVLQEKRAAYGEAIVSTLSNQLAAEYGRGYSKPNLSRMMWLAEAFPEPEIVSALSKQLSWSHFAEILPLEDPLKRDSYAELCRVERWNVRTLRHKIGHLLYERTAVSKKPDEPIAQDLAALRDEDRMTPDLVFRDPYFLDFLRLTGLYAEKDVEQSILRELEAFILELGGDFAFVARQKRITVDNEDYYLDLLSYHRRSRRLVAVELKPGRFQAADKGQMELYLRWLEQHDTRPGEEPPLGLILCVDKSDEHVALLQLDKGGIRVARYLTELPPCEVLEKTLHDSIRRAREHLVLATRDRSSVADQIPPPPSAIQRRPKRS